MANNKITSAIEAIGVSESDVLSSKDHKDYVVVVTNAGQKFSYDGSAVTLLSGQPLIKPESEPIDNLEVEESIEIVEIAQTDADPAPKPKRKR